MIIIGLILTLVVTIPILLFAIVLLQSSIYRDRQERPGSKPPSKDDWKVL